MIQFLPYVFLFLIGSLLLSTSLRGQSVKGTITDENSEGIPFANIYVSSESKGTVSDVNGLFSLLLKSAHLDSLVTISCIGYETEKIPLRGLLDGSVPTIALNDIDYELAEATIIGSNLNYTDAKILGNAKRDNVPGGPNQDSTASAGMEIGNLMKTKHSWTLDKIGFHIVKISRDTMHFEVNIYKAKKGFPSKPINRNRIFLNVDTSMLKAPIVIDLKDQNIYGNGEFLVTIEMLDQVDSRDYIRFPARLKKGLTRFHAGDRRWRKAPFFMSIGIWAEVREAK